MPWPWQGQRLAGMRFYLARSFFFGLRRCRWKKYEDIQTCTLIELNKKRHFGLWRLRRRTFYDRLWSSRQWWPAWQVNYYQTRKHYSLLRSKARHSLYWYKITYHALAWKRFLYFAFTPHKALSGVNSLCYEVRYVDGTVIALPDVS